MDIKEKAIERLDKLAKTLRDKGLVIATKEEVMEWKAMIVEKPEKDTTNPPQPRDPHTVSGDFVVLAVGGSLIPVRRIYDEELGRWIWLYDLCGGCLIINDDQVEYWIQLPSLPDAANSKPKEKP